MASLGNLEKSARRGHFGGILSYLMREPSIAELEDISGRRRLKSSFVSRHREGKPTAIAVAMGEE